MGGRIRTRGDSPKYMRPRDMTGKWEKQSRALANRLGFYEHEVWELFQQLAAMREYEHVVRYGREVHEAMAFLDLTAIYAKADTEQLPC